MALHAENLNIFWGSLLVEELVRNGVDYFCLSPGSRSTPLTIAVARNGQTRHSLIYDERSAAFHALGYARGSGKPAVLVCTSGTAIANYYPAVVEASTDNIPLIILSADRPPEKIETGANQTIRQSKFFGDYARWQFDLPCPSPDIPPELVLTTVDHALHRALSAPAGPVHLNCPFRDPLPPLKKAFPAAYRKSLRNWISAPSPYTRYAAVQKTVSTLTMSDLLHLIGNTGRGLVVAGRLKSESDRQAVAGCARQLNWPLFADVLSGMRLGNHHPTLIPYFDLMLLSEPVQEEIRPQTVIHFGDQPASKRFLQFIEKISPENYVLIQANPPRSDPTHRVTWRIESHISALCAQMPVRVESWPEGEWLRRMQQFSSSIGRIIERQLSAETDISEPAVARLISQHLPAEHALFLANSLPIREMDMFADPAGESVTVSCNRGVSGIDGTIASAAGFARGQKRPVTLLVGDLAFLHDLNSLALLAELPFPLVIVLVNNQGGGIFSFLPIAQFSDVFEPFFGTPHAIGFQQAAALFNIAYSAPATTKDFLKAYQKAVNQKHSSLIEIRTDRQENFRFHQKLYNSIIATLEKQFKR